MLPNGIDIHSADLFSKFRDALPFAKILLDELDHPNGAIRLDDYSHLIVENDGSDDQIIFER